VSHGVMCAPTVSQGTSPITLPSPPKKVTTGVTAFILSLGQACVVSEALLPGVLTVAWEQEAWSQGSSIGAALTPAQQGTSLIPMIGMEAAVQEEGSQGPAAKARSLPEKRQLAKAVPVVAHPDWTVGCPKHPFPSTSTGHVHRAHSSSGLQGGRGATFGFVAGTHCSLVPLEDSSLTLPGARRKQTQSTGVRGTGAAWEVTAAPQEGPLWRVSPRTHFVTHGREGSDQAQLVALVCGQRRGPVC
jgi:hypothetical protein